MSENIENAKILENTVQSKDTVKSETVIKAENTPNNALNNNAVYHGRLHWVIFVKALAILLVGLYIEYHFGKWFGLPLIGAGIFWGGLLYLQYLNASIQITSESIIIQTGVLVRNTLHFSRRQLESVDMMQTIMGSFLNYGSLSVRGTGGTRAFFSPITEPLTCRRFLETTS